MPSRAVSRLGDPFGDGFHHLFWAMLDGEDPGRKPRIEEIYTPQVIRKRLAMTREQFARALRIPVATLRNWEQGRNSTAPAARLLLIVVARDPRAALGQRTLLSCSTGSSPKLSAKEKMIRIIYCIRC